MDSRQKTYQKRVIDVARQEGALHSTISSGDSDSEMISTTARGNSERAYDLLNPSGLKKLVLDVQSFGNESSTSCKANEENRGKE